MTNMSDPQLNNLAKNLFSKIDFDNNEFVFVMFYSLISILLDKGVVTREEFEDATKDTGSTFKILKQLNKLQENSENTDVE